MRELTDKKKQAIDVLMKEYAASKAEMGIYIALFHKHSNLTPILIGAILTFLAGTASINTKNSPLFEELLATNLISFGIIESSVLSSVLFFLYISFLIVGMFYFSAAMGYLYLIELIAQRMRVVEGKVNRQIGIRLLTWDNEISAKFITHSNENFGMLVPNKMRVFWSQSSFVLIWLYLIMTSNIILGLHLSILFAAISMAVIVIYFVQVRNYSRVIVPAIRRMGLD